MTAAGRLKEKSYDPYTGVSTLQAAWVSRASEKQRRGRAGRCQPGVAFHCYSRTRSQALAELQLPELKRSPLDELCLQVSCKLRVFREAGGVGEGWSPGQKVQVGAEAEAFVFLSDCSCWCSNTAPLMSFACMSVAQLHAFREGGREKGGRKFASKGSEVRAEGVGGGRSSGSISCPAGCSTSAGFLGLILSTYNV